MSRFEILLAGSPVFLSDLENLDSLEVTCPGDFDERKHYQFALRDRNPNIEYAIQIGVDEFHEFAEIGTDHLSDVIWPALRAPRLESCAGSTAISLLFRIGEESDWEIGLVVTVYVRPSKMGAQSYDAMLEALRNISGSLIFDIVSKSTRHIGFDSLSERVTWVPANTELRRLKALVHDAHRILLQIDAHPTMAVALENSYRRVGFEALYSASTCIKMMTTGIPLSAAGEARPFLWLRTKVERPVIIENQIIAGFLETLSLASARILLRANAQAQSLWGVKPFRLLEDGTTPLFDAEELPRIRRLEAIESEARTIQTQINALRTRKIFKGSRPNYSLRLTPIFRHVPTYNAMFRLMRQYLRMDRWVLEDGYDENIKLTSRLYEHWVFLQIASALRFCGLRGGSHEGLFRERAASRFTLDLDKGTVLRYFLPDNQCLRLRCEPFILPREAAARNGEPLFDSRTVRYGIPNPDLLLEFIQPGTDQHGPVVYAATLDAKYKAKIHPDDWLKTKKYFAIRATSSERKVMRQLWLVYPGGHGVEPEDATVRWGEEPTDWQKEEELSGTVGMLPRAPAEVSAGESSYLSIGAVQFISGLLTFYKGANPLWSNAASRLRTTMNHGSS